MNIEQRINTVITLAMEKITFAASKQNTFEISRYSKVAEASEQLKKKLQGIKDTLESLEADLKPNQRTEPDKTRLTDKNLRHFRIRVSQGMINQNLLTFTPQVKYRELSIGEVLRIETSEGGLFKSEIISQGNKLRERGHVREFYEKARIKADDFVELIERRPSEWYLRPATNN
jgi:hypothetical protein